MAINNTVIEDDIFERRNVLQITIEQHEALLIGIRERRLALVQKMERVAKVKANMAEMNRIIRFNAISKTVTSDIAKLDKAINKIEEKLNKMRILKFEIET